MSQTPSPLTYVSWWSVLWSVAQEAGLMLRRDRFFFPALLGAGFVFGIAQVASGWGIFEFQKILFDIGGLGFQVIGGGMAIFWGTKRIQDARKEGVLEVQLAGVVQPSSWFVGQWLGLCLALLSLGALMLAFWQVLMLINNFGWLQADQAACLGLMILAWLVLASLAMFFSSFCSSNVALFSSLSAWVSGLSASLVLTTLPPNSQPSLVSVLDTIVLFWDLQRFHWVGVLGQAQFPNTAELWAHTAYGLSLCLTFVFLGQWIFRSRDLV